MKPPDAAKRRPWLLPSIVAVAVAVALGTAPARVWAAQEGRLIVGEVLITQGDDGMQLSPEILVTAPEHRVVFVNRSCHLIHLQFLMPGGVGIPHHVFQVPTSIWAVFHQTGSHPYVVHFDDPSLAPLHGTVEVVASESGGPTHRVCNGITVQGECVER